MLRDDDDSADSGGGGGGDGVVSILPSTHRRVAGTEHNVWRQSNGGLMGCYCFISVKISFIFQLFPLLSHLLQRCQPPAATTARSSGSALRAPTQGGVKMAERVDEENGAL